MEGNIPSPLKKLFVGQVGNYKKAREQRRNVYEILQLQVRRLQERKGRRMEKVK